MKVDRSIIDAAFQEENTLESELEADVLDRENREWFADDWKQELEEPEKEYLCDYDPWDYDYTDGRYDPYPSNHDDFYHGAI